MKKKHRVCFIDGEADELSRVRYINSFLCRQSSRSGSAPQKVSAIAQLATTFSGDEAIEVYDKIADFKQSIQEEILKRTARDVSRIEC